MSTRQVQGVGDGGCFHDDHPPTLSDQLKEHLVGNLGVATSAFQFEPAARAARQHPVHV
jgi:hypothetical protein